MPRPCRWRWPNGRAHEQLKITLMTGASLGSDVDKTLTEAGVLARRIPFQADPVLRAAINRGEVMYIDQHLSETVELLRTRQIAPIDIAIIEAIAITESGAIIPPPRWATAPVLPFWPTR